ncbi:hypothetical protein GF312_09785 [Candidatus Poribacteria bacterium]|nr:hypothetical protein [Candidatus Poribacteria bacterium]
MLELGICLSLILAYGNTEVEPENLSIATFRVDATPPLDTPLCGGGVEPAKKIIDRLTVRGVIFITDESPVLLCAVDWVGIGNSGQDEWKKELAKSAGTTPDRVCVHTVHQHDTPGCDFAAEEMLSEHGIGGSMFMVEFTRHTITRTSEAIRQALKSPVEVTHMSVGKAKVEKVASNRRVLGPDGKVKHVRYSSCRDEEAIAAPEGVIDPYLRNIIFWCSEHAIVSMTYYATHPQSFYGSGAVSTDFVGMARSIREATLPDVFHIHFNGAGGNVAAGKYNDGSPVNRLILAQRMLEGMEKAWENAVKIPIVADDLKWKTIPVALPLRDHLVNGEEELEKTLSDPDADIRSRIRAARDLVWTQGCKSGQKIQLSCLQLSDTYIIHMPGELFVEYQLASQEMLPDKTVCMAAYGDYGPGYIGTEISYSQGGYETSYVSRVAPQVEKVLMEAMRKLLISDNPAK